MTTDEIWSSLVKFLTSLGGNDPISMIHDTPSFVSIVDDYIKKLESSEAKNIELNLGFFLGEFLCQKYSGYWDLDTKNPQVIIGPDENDLVYQTNSKVIFIDTSDGSNLTIDPFLIAVNYLRKTEKTGISNYIERIVTQGLISNCGRGGYLNKSSYLSGGKTRKDSE